MGKKEEKNSLHIYTVLGIFILLLTVFSISIVSAKTYTVGYLGDSPYYTNASGTDESISINDPIQRAIDDAAAGDSIKITQGVYNGTININKNNLTIYGNVGAGRINITLNNTRIKHSGFVIRVGQVAGVYNNGSNAVLENLTINVFNGTSAIELFANNFSIKNVVINYCMNDSSSGACGDTILNSNASLIKIGSSYANISSGLISNVVLTNLSTNTPESVANIHLVATNNNISSITISNSNITGGNSTVAGGRASGILLDGGRNGILISSIIISNNNITHTAHAIFLSNVTSINITRNHIANTSLAGVSVSMFKNDSAGFSGEFFITYNNFTKNSLASIYTCNSSGSGDANLNITELNNKIISYNSFVGNGLAVNNSCKDRDIIGLNLTFNYWNSVNGPGNVTYSTISSSGGLNITGGNATTIFAPWYEDSSLFVLHSIKIGNSYYDTLDDAVKNATHSDTITLGNGTYETNASLFALTGVTITGNGLGTVIRGNASSVLELGNSSVLNNVTIWNNGRTTGVLARGSGFVIKNSYFKEAGPAIFVLSTVNNITQGNINNNLIFNTSGSSLVGEVNSSAISLNASGNNINSITIANNTINRVNISVYIGGHTTVTSISRIIIESNLFNNSLSGIVLSNVTSVNISRNRFTNVSLFNIVIKGFKNSSIDEFFITYNNFTTQFRDAKYPMIFTCNVTGSTSKDYANLTDISKKIISYNSFVGNGTAVNNSCTDVNLSLNLTFNYWNSVAGPGNVTHSTVGGTAGMNITLGGGANNNATLFVPWYEDSSLSVLHSIKIGNTYYESLDKAVKNATHSDTITLGNGTYETNASLFALTGVTITGNGLGTVIRGNASSVLELGNSSVLNNVTIWNNLNFTGVLARGSGFVIKNSYFKEAGPAILVLSTKMNITQGNIINNLIFNSSVNGGDFNKPAIWLNASENKINSVTIANNTIANSTVAIIVEGSGARLANNIAQILIQSNIINQSIWGVVMENVSSINLTYNKFSNISRDSILIKGFRNSSIDEFFIKYNNFSDIYNGAGAYAVIRACNVTASTSKDYANLTDISKKIISYNSFVGTGVGVNNSCTDVNLSLNLTFNYWNSAAGPGNISGTRSPSSGMNITLGGSANTNATIYVPWAIDLNLTKFLTGVNLITGGDIRTAANINITNNNTVIVLNASATNSVIYVNKSGADDATLSFAVLLNASADVRTNNTMNITVDTTDGTVQIRFPTNTNISSKGVTWDGTIYLADLLGDGNATPTDAAGYTEAVSKVYEIGSPSVNLTFDRAIKINISGEGSKYVGYARDNTVTSFTEITAACSADTQAVGDALSAGGECKIAQGNDLIIWTKHFSRFATYTKTAVAAAAAASSAAGKSATAVVQEWVNTYVVTDAQFETGYTKQIIVKERMKFSVDAKTHYIALKELTGTTATVELTGDPIKVALDVGDDAKVDVTNDGYYDIYVMLNSIANSKADMTIRKIHEKVPEEVEGPAETTGEIVTAPEEAERDLTWVWVIVIVLIIVAVIGAGVAYKKRR